MSKRQRSSGDDRALRRADNALDVAHIAAQTLLHEAQLVSRKRERAYAFLEI
jgi:hypothetical protein